MDIPQFPYVVTEDDYELTKYQSDITQSTFVVTENWDGPMFKRCAVYYPPRYSVFEVEFDDFFRSLGYRFVVRNFYSKHHNWCSRLTNLVWHTLNKTSTTYDASPQLNQLADLRTIMKFLIHWISLFPKGYRLIKRQSTKLDVSSHYSPIT